MLLFDSGIDAIDMPVVSWARTRKIRLDLIGRTRSVIILKITIRDLIVKNVKFIVN